MKRGKAFPLVYVTWVKSVEGRGRGERWRDEWLPIGKRNVSLEMEEGSTTKRSFPQAGRRREGKRNEGERERDGWRNMWGMYVRTRKRREINSHGLRGIGRAEFILRIRRIFLSRCNCNDDLYKRIDFLPRISPGQRPEQESIILSMYLLFKNVRALFSHFSPIFYRSRIL